MTRPPRRSWGSWARCSRSKGHTVRRTHLHRQRKHVHHKGPNGPPVPETFDHGTGHSRGKHSWGKAPEPETFGHHAAEMLTHHAAWHSGTGQVTPLGTTLHRHREHIHHRVHRGHRVSREGTLWGRPLNQRWLRHHGTGQVTPIRLASLAQGGPRRTHTKNSPPRGQASLFTHRRSTHEFTLSE